MNALSFVVILIYVLFFGIVALISLLPVVINAIGLARICKKFGAFGPFWTWVWALLVPSVAVLRVGDLAAERVDPYGYHRQFHKGLVAMIVFGVLISLTTGCFGVVTAVSAIGGAQDLQALATVAALVLLVPTVIAAVFAAIPLYISYYRIFKAYMPAWAAVLLLVGMLVLSEFAFLVFPVLSFLPWYYPDAKKAA